MMWHHLNFEDKPRGYLLIARYLLGGLQETLKKAQKRCYLS